jgi:hypothetical protein
MGRLAHLYRGTLEPKPDGDRSGLGVEGNYNYAPQVIDARVTRPLLPQDRLPPARVLRSNTNPASTTPIVSGTYAFQQISFGSYTYRSPDATGGINLREDGTFTFLLAVTRAPDTGSIYYDGPYTYSSNILALRPAGGNDLNISFDPATFTITVRLTWATGPVTATYRRS